MGSGHSTPNKHDFLDCNNDYELAIKASKDLEFILERHFGAHGRGLHEKISSARGLSSNLTRDMRYLATIRNKLIHERGFDYIPDRQAFRERFLRSSEELELLIKARSHSDDSECVIL
jgi:hypothetical protein